MWFRFGFLDGVILQKMETKQIYKIGNFFTIFIVKEEEVVFDVTNEIYGC